MSGGAAMSGVSRDNERHKLRGNFKLLLPVPFAAIPFAAPPLELRANNPAMLVLCKSDLPITARV